MEAIVYESSEIFIPDTVHIDILEAVVEKPGSPIRHVVNKLLPYHNERIIRNSIHELLSKRYLDGGRPTNDILLRLTSKGRILLQQTAS